MTATPDMDAVGLPLTDDDSESFDLPSAGDSLFNVADDAFNAKNYSTALTNYLHAFQAYRYEKNALGAGYAANAIAFMFEKGLGVPANKTMSCAWDKKAAEHGNATSMYNLAIEYDSGEFLEQDFKKAHELFEVAYYVYGIEDAAYYLFIYHELRLAGAPTNVTAATGNNLQKRQSLLDALLALPDTVISPDINIALVRFKLLQLPEFRHHMPALFKLHEPNWFRTFNNNLENLITADPELLYFYSDFLVSDCVQKTVAVHSALIGALVHAHETLYKALAAEFHEHNSALKHQAIDDAHGNKAAYLTTLMQRHLNPFVYLDEDEPAAAATATPKRFTVDASVQTNAVEEPLTEEEARRFHFFHH